jgi:hypothetical protein
VVALHLDDRVIRAPRETATCSGCGQRHYWPALLMHPHERAGPWRRVVRICGRCFPHVHLLWHPDTCAAVRSRSEARTAWGRHVAPLLFDQVRQGLPEPADLAELIWWLEAERGRQALIARRLAAELGPGLTYEPPIAIRQVLAACMGRLVP